jgi:hypothetical protein
MNDAAFTTIRCLWEDRLITAEQCQVLAGVAEEFARLNRAAIDLEAGRVRLLHISREVIRNLGTKES